MLQSNDGEHTDCYEGGRESLGLIGLIAAAKGYIGRPHPRYNDRMTSYSGSL